MYSKFIHLFLLMITAVLNLALTEMANAECQILDPISGLPTDFKTFTDLQRDAQDTWKGYIKSKDIADQRKNFESRKASDTVALVVVSLAEGKRDISDTVYTQGARRTKAGFGADLARTTCFNMADHYDHVDTIFADDWTRASLTKALELYGSQRAHVAVLSHATDIGGDVLLVDSSKNRTYTMPTQNIIDMGFRRFFFGGCSSIIGLQRMTADQAGAFFTQIHAEIFFLARYPDLLVNEGKIGDPYIFSSIKNDVWSHLGGLSQRAVPIWVEGTNMSRREMRRNQ